MLLLPRMPSIQVRPPPSQRPAISNPDFLPRSHAPPLCHSSFAANALTRPARLAPSCPSEETRAEEYHGETHHGRGVGPREGETPEGGAHGYKQQEHGRFSFVRAMTCSLFQETTLQTFQSSSTSVCPIQKASECFSVNHLLFF